MLLNADLGESWYDRRVGNDEALMPNLDLCNLACGFHGGDALTIYRTIELAHHHGVSIGAHPSFPDRKNFGRQRMTLDADSLYALLLYQVSALQGMAMSITGNQLNHLKPHGALYHFANDNTEAAEVIVRVTQQLEIPYLIGPPAGALREAADHNKLDYLAEGFADRAYQPSLHLRPRTYDDACLEEIEQAVAQTKLLTEGKVRAVDGNLYALKVDTLCLHGDHARAAERARAVQAVLNEAIPPPPQ
jgi:UPF0271 protein